MVVVCFAATMARAQQPSSSVPPQPPSDASPALSPAPPAARYSSDEIIDAGHHFFGGISRGVASIVEKAANQWASPTDTFLAKRRGAPSSVACDMAMVLYLPRMPATYNGARTMMLVYNLPRTDAIYQQFNGIAGAAYFVAGLGMTALTSGDEQKVHGFLSAAKPGR